VINEQGIMRLQEGREQVNALVTRSKNFASGPAVLWHAGYVRPNKSLRVTEVGYDHIRTLHKSRLNYWPVYYYTHSDCSNNAIKQGTHGTYVQQYECNYVAKLRTLCGMRITELYTRHEYRNRYERYISLCTDTHDQHWIYICGNPWLITMWKQQM
jgi:hypothetical protein